MRRGMRGFILSLEGPPCSYCFCNKLCGDAEIDHVVPQFYLKNKISNRKFLFDAINDPHNMYRVCHDQNSRKGKYLLSIKASEFEFAGLMARSYLYMNSTYHLQFDSYFLETLKYLSTFHPPFPYEVRRSRQISQYTGHINTFIEYFPLTISTKN